MRLMIELLSKTTARSYEQETGSEPYEIRYETHELHKSLKVLVLGSELYSP